MQSRDIIKVINGLATVQRRAGKPLFGRTISKIAKKYGMIHILTPDMVPDEQLPFMNKARTAPNLRKIPRDFRGIVINALGKKLKAPLGARYKIIGEPGYLSNYAVKNPLADTNKLTESLLLHRIGVGPKSLSLKVLANRHNIVKSDPDFRIKLKQAIVKELGDKYILKDIYGAATPHPPTEKSRSFIFSSPAKILDRVFVQERRQLKPLGYAGKAVNNVLSGTYPSVSHGATEYRVHTIGGKVPSGMTFHRGSPLYSTAPIQTSDARKAELFARKVLRRLPSNRRLKSFGMDIGIDVKGKPFAIELNPSTMHGGASGFLPYERTLSNLESSIVGVNPIKRKAMDLGYYAAEPLSYVPRKTLLGSGLGVLGMGSIGIPAYETHKHRTMRFPWLDSINTNRITDLKDRIITHLT